MDRRFTVDNPTDQLPRCRINGRVRCVVEETEDHIIPADTSAVLEVAPLRDETISAKDVLVLVLRKIGAAECSATARYNPLRAKRWQLTAR